MLNYSDLEYNTVPEIVILYKYCTQAPHSSGLLGVRMLFSDQKDLPCMFITGTSTRIKSFGQLGVCTCATQETHCRKQKFCSRYVCLESWRQEARTSKQVFLIVGIRSYTSPVW